MSKGIAFLFPGQGSQFIGMGQDLCERYPEVKREIFWQVDEICKKGISRLCFEGPLNELTLTENLQPAITAVSLACLHALEKAGIRPKMTGGHSLGEYSALVGAGCISYQEALRLVRKRGQLMQREADAHPGSMAAVIGLPIERVEGIVAEAREGQVLSVANYNTIEQVVITGEKAALDRALERVQAEGGRAVPLNVSGAWHCSLMAGGVEELRAFMGDVHFKSPAATMLFNATAAAEENPDTIKDIMARQLTSPVKWYQIVRAMLDSGIDTFVEVGPKKVLTGLIRKIVSKEEKVRTFSVQDIKSFDAFMETV